MDGDDEFDIDPAIAAAMGFSGFGAQNKQKRKFDTNESFVDSATGQSKSAGGTGANSMPVRERSEKSAKVTADSSAARTPFAGPTDIQSNAPVAYDPSTQDSPSLEALRHGVRNTRGDMVYFSKSFLEDPWAGLKAQDRLLRQHEDLESSLMPGLIKYDYAIMASLTEQARERIEELFDYKIKRLDLLEEALHAGGPIYIASRPIPEQNKNLALIGDSVLKTVLVTDSYEAGMKKGPSTYRTSFVLSNTNLDVVGRAQGIDEFLVLNDNYQKVSLYMVATAVEAVIGAVYIDSGMDTKVIQRGMLAFGLL